MNSRTERILSMIRDKKLCIPSEDTEKIVGDDNKNQVITQPNFQQTQNINAEINVLEQPSTSGHQKRLKSKTYSIEISHKENVKSGSIYLTSSDEEYSNDSFVSPKTYKYEDVHRIKRKVFLHDNEIDKKVEILYKNRFDISKNLDNMGRLDKDIRTVTEEDVETQNEDVPTDLRQDRNVEMHGNEYKKLHVTADGINKSEITIKPNSKVAKNRARNPDNWKRNKAARLRQQGEEYISQKTGKNMKKKVIKTGILCKEKCRLQCSEKFSVEGREKILKKFYQQDINSKNVLIFKSIKIQEVNRHRSRRNLKTKSYTFKYTVTYDKETVLVCKDTFCSLYGIGRKKVLKSQNELKSGKVAPSPHKQGYHKNPKKIPTDVITCIENHIKQFPSEESHYSRNKNQHKKYLSPSLSINRLRQLYIEQCEERKLENKYMVKASFYRHIFETKFNFSFGAPKSDTCSVCDAGENSSEHTENFQFAFALQKDDREVTLIDKKICYITMDLQQTMPLPKLSTSKSFYLRQMWLYNFGVHCINSSGHKSYFFTWTEDIANRGSNEIASCLLRFCKLLKEEKPEIEHLIIWSDQCGGQNKNFAIVCLYEYLILNNIFKIIDHKLPEVGHSYLDSDRDFGRIEKVLRKHQNIYIPDQYREIIKYASTKQSVCFNMEHFFYDFETLPAKLHLNKKLTNCLNQKINIRAKVKWIRVNDFGNYSYKTSLDPFTPFMEVDMQKKREPLVQDEKVDLQKLPKCGGLTSEKISNLQDQLKFIPTYYRWYYDIVLEEAMKNPKKNGIPVRF